jgi:hypothetical protein
MMAVYFIKTQAKKGERSKRREKQSSKGGKNVQSAETHVNVLFYFFRILQKNISSLIHIASLRRARGLASPRFAGQEGLLATFFPSFT